MAGRYLIAIASYRRPDLLRRLLDSLASSIDPAVADIVVVDNDGSGSARRVSESHPLRPTYVVEPRPGIAAARNRGMTHFSDQHVAVIFVDDDEWVDPGWFSALTSYARRSGAGVVQGLVVTELPANAPTWIVRGGFYQRPQRATGEVLTAAATNNTLLTRTAWLRAGSPAFDESFSTTGGSDWDLFWGIRKSGVTIRYCADAVATEDVPADRLGWRWLRKRYLRNGVVAVRVRSKHGEGGARLVVGALLRFVYGVALLASDLFRGRGVRVTPVKKIYYELGSIMGAAGMRIHEYRRRT